MVIDFQVGDKVRDEFTGHEGRIILFSADSPFSAVVELPSEDGRCVESLPIGRLARVAEDADPPA